MPSLRLNSAGPDVVALQRALAAAGFAPGDFDGVFGGGTEAALIAFQRSEGLVADGVAGPKTASALGLDGFGEPPNVTGAVTVAMVGAMFPSTPVRNIKANLPFVLDALVERKIADKPMVLMALATIRAETESFLPINEGISRFNTSPGGREFDLYDNRRDLGNQGAPDGASFRGRGFIQLTGRANYGQHGRAIGLGDQLLSKPELANDPTTASRLLASFLGSKEIGIKQALLTNDLARARRLVNGGSHGLDRFSDAFRIGMRVIPENLALVAGA
jgi:putative chitinase